MVYRHFFIPSGFARNFFRLLVLSLRQDAGLRLCCRAVQVSPMAWAQGHADVVWPLLRISDSRASQSNFWAPRREVSVALEQEGS